MIAFIVFTVIYGFSAFITCFFLYESEKVSASVGWILFITPIVNTIVAIKIISKLLTQIISKR